MLQMDPLEDEPNDGYEPYAMQQGMQPHGGQLMMTTQVTKKIHPASTGRLHGLHLKMQLMTGVT